MTRLEFIDDCIIKTTGLEIHEGPVRHFTDHTQTRINDKYYMSCVGMRLEAHNGKSGAKNYKDPDAVWVLKLQGEEAQKKEEQEANDPAEEEKEDEDEDEDEEEQEDREGKDREEDDEDNNDNEEEEGQGQGQESENEQDEVDYSGYWLSCAKNTGVPVGIAEVLYTQTRSSGEGKCKGTLEAQPSIGWGVAIDIKEKGAWKPPHISRSSRVRHVLTSWRDSLKEENAVIKGAVVHKHSDIYQGVQKFKWWSKAQNSVYYLVSNTFPYRWAGDMSCCYH